MNATEFCFFHRSSEKHGNSNCKIEIRNGAEWLEGKDLGTAYYSGKPEIIGERLRSTVRLLRDYGLTDDKIPLLLSRKQVHMNTPLPLEELKRIGWKTNYYPYKFGNVLDEHRLIVESYDYGIGMDASNVISSPHTRDTKGLALKGIVDKLDSLCIKSYLYMDQRTWGWLERNGLMELKNYLESSCDGSLYAKVVTAPRNMKADDFMVGHADSNGQHQLTRDELDEYDTRFDWLLHGAERGAPRIHKFKRKNYNHIIIPDYGFYIKIPQSF